MTTRADRRDEHGAESVLCATGASGGFVRRRGLHGRHDRVGLVDAVSHYEPRRPDCGESRPPARGDRWVRPPADSIRWPSPRAAWRNRRSGVRTTRAGWPRNGTFSCARAATTSGRGNSVVRLVDFASSTRPELRNTLAAQRRSQSATPTFSSSASREPAGPADGHREAHAFQRVERRKPLKPVAQFIVGVPFTKTSVCESHLIGEIQSSLNPMS